MAAVASPNASPFLLKLDDVESLSQSEGFTILRQHLARYCKYDLCDQHRSMCSQDADRWLLTRDVMHALLVPIVELYDKAEAVAAQATHATRPEDLEYAYAGDARGAFVWLQCFLEKERDWCSTRGCPACVAVHVLDSEFTIRMLHAACLLSDVHYPFTLEGPTLPSFMFFVDSLRGALDDDPLWGPDYFEFAHPKAVVTRNGVEDLIRQCLELDAILSAPSTPSHSSPASPDSSAAPSPVLGPLGAPPTIGGPRGAMKIRRSKMARRQKKLQMHLEMEEEQWMAEMLKRCWDELQPATPLAVDSAAFLPVPTQSLNAVLQGEPVISNPGFDEIAAV